MVNLSIPLKTDGGIGGGGGAADYETTLDAQYDVYSPVLRNYPVIDAFVFDSNTSQEKWGLQLAARAAQNTAWQSQLGFGLAQGTGNLERFSTSYAFNINIESLDSGNIRTAAYGKKDAANSDEQLLKFSGSTINSVDNIVLSNEIGFSSVSENIKISKKAFVATSGGNKFIISGGVNSIRVTPVDGTYQPTGATTTHTVDDSFLTNSAGSVSYTHIVAVKDDTIWVWMQQGAFGNNRVGTSQGGYILTIDSLGVVSDVAASNTIDYQSQKANPGGAFDTVSTAFGTYIDTDNAYFIGETWHFGGGGNFSGLSFVADVDLTNTSVFTLAIHSNDETETVQTDYSDFATDRDECRNLSVGYDGTYIFAMTFNGVFYGIDSGGTEVTLPGTPTQPSYRDLQALSKTPTLQTDNSTMIGGQGDQLNILGTFAQGTRTDLSIYLMYTYDMAVNADQDQALVGGFLQNTTDTYSIANTSDFSVDIQYRDSASIFQTIETIDISNHISFTSELINTLILTPIVIDRPRMELRMGLNNNTGQPAKIGFGLNGGNYDLPTGNYEISELNLTL